MYSPEIGRFLQPDPIGYADSMNLYQYCGNNPIKYIDPYGLDYWVQGSLWGHRSFCVGDPKGKFSSYGFYPTTIKFWNSPGMINGPRDNIAGNYQHKFPIKTTSEKDSEIKDTMDKLMDNYNSLPPEQRDAYIYGLYDCHSFANQMYDYFNDLLGLKPPSIEIEPEMIIW